MKQYNLNLINLYKIDLDNNIFKSILEKINDINDIKKLKQYLNYNRLINFKDNFNTIYIKENLQNKEEEEGEVEVEVEEGEEEEEVEGEVEEEGEEEGKREEEEEKGEGENIYIFKNKELLNSFININIMYLIIMYNQNINEENKIKSTIINKINTKIRNKKILYIITNYLLTSDNNNLTIFFNYVK